MKVMFLVNGRWFKTLCKTVLEADTFDVSISTEKHNIHALISDKCYFKSIDKYCLGYDTIDTIKTDFFISRNFKNTKEFVSKLDDTLDSFLNTSIRDKHFFGNIDECIEKCIQEIKKTPENNTTYNTKETPTAHAKSLLNSEYGITATAHAKSLLNSVYGITAENDTTYKMNDVQFEAFKCQLKCLAPCDFPPDIVLTQITDEMTEKQLKDYCKILLDKGLAQYHRGVIATSKMGYTLYTLTHTYKILVFKNDTLIRSYDFSLESFAEYAFTIMELNAIDFPEPCFKAIQLFKDGKVVKRSVIHFGEKLV